MFSWYKYLIVNLVFFPPRFLEWKLLHDGQEFYGDLVYKFMKHIGTNDFSFQFRKIITRYRRIGYNLNAMRQSACLVFST